MTKQSLFLVLLAASALAQAPAIRGSAKDLTLSVTADGTQPFSYQWFRNGTAIPGATSVNYVVPSISTTGTFFCRVSNSAGSTDSDKVKLATTSVTAAPAVTITRKK